MKQGVVSNLFFIFYFVIKQLVRTMKEKVNYFDCSNFSIINYN